MSPLNKTQASSKGRSRLLSLAVTLVLAWTAHTQAQEAITADPDAVSWDANRVDIFARGTPDGLWHNWGDSNGWGGGENLGGGLIGGPAVSSWGTGRLDVFVRGENSALYQKTFENTWQQDWVMLSTANQLTSDPAAISWNQDRVDVFAKGDPNGLWYMWWDRASGWAGPENLGGGLIGGPGVSSWGANRLDVFVKGDNGALFHKAYDGVWREWEQLGPASALASDPTAVAWSQDRIDVFAKSNANTLWHMWWNRSGGWGGPEDLGGNLGSGPAVSSKGAGQLQVFAADASKPGQVMVKTFDQAGWHEWAPVQPPSTQTAIVSTSSAPPPAYSQADPNTWPQYFTGDTNMGPYAWLTVAEISAKGLSLDNAVIGGQAGGQNMAVCRAILDNGVHTGKLFAGNCNIGYDGQEVVKADYQVLVNTQPDKAQFLKVDWVNPTYGDRTTVFQGGAVGGKTMSVCHAWSSTYDTQPGKEWEGKCYYGFGGVEKSDAAYGMLVLGFDKAAWQAAQSSVTSGGTISGTIVLNQDLTLNQSTTTITPGTETFSEGDNPDMLSYADAVRRTWNLDNLGTGLTDLVHSLPNLMPSVVDKYNASCLKPEDRKDRETLLSGVMTGDASAEGTMVVLLVGLAKDLMGREPDSWSTDEANFVQFLQALAQNQRQKTAALAQQAFKEWYASEQDKAAQTGLLLLSNVITDPPPEILAMAQKGYSVPPQHADNFSAILAASAGFSSSMLAFAAGVGTGAGLSFVTTFVPTVNAALAFGRGLGGLMAGSGAFAVVTLLVTAGVIQTIDVIQYEEYVKKLNEAVAALQQPVSVAQLKELLSNAEGGKAVFYWFVAQAATK